ncbi:Converts alpha-aldose to the beta-anomer [Coemansia sp. Benny D115]|nr:Converts alpha-aldose to the beta-anomer [Coemansia sp. Benny D115]
MPVAKQAFSTDGSVSEYILTNSNGTKLYVTNWGARVTRFIIKDAGGTTRDLVPGFDSYEKWQESLQIDDPYFGATIGRVAGRIWPCDQVELANSTYQLPEIQPNKVCLHGGRQGFDKKLFEARILCEESNKPASVQFIYVSPDGEEGFPGTVELSVTYTLEVDADSMHIEYKGKLLEGSETMLNPTNHTYWNLTGFKEEPTIHDHVCKLAAERYMATRPDHPMIPTGALSPVAGTALDFYQAPRRFGQDLDKFDQNTTRGYDHIFAVSEAPVQKVREVARVWSEKSGLRLTVLSDQPALIMYTGNWISDRLVGKNNVRYGNYAAVAFETQRFPNAINIPEFRSQVLLHPGETFTQRSVYRLDRI